MLLLLLHQCYHLFVFIERCSFCYVLYRVHIEFGAATQRNAKQRMQERGAVWRVVLRDVA